MLEVFSFAGVAEVRLVENSQSKVKFKWLDLFLLIRYIF